MKEDLTTKEFWVNLMEQLLHWFVETGPKLVLVFIIYWVTSRLLRFLLKRIHHIFLKRLKASEDFDGESEKRATTLFGIVRGTLKVAWVVIFTLIALRELGIDIGPLLAGAGILGLAVGFGAQELVRDVISGFFILLENQIRAGDVAVINGTGGLVEKIQLRTVTLRDFSQTVHIFQNGKINSLSNMTMGWSAAVFDIGVAYKEDVDRVMEFMKTVGKELREDSAFEMRINEDIEVLGLESFGDSAIVIKARIKTIPGEQWNVAREYRKRLKRVFDKEKIEIPFPHRTIYWGEQINPLKMEKTA